MAKKKVELHPQGQAKNPQAHADTNPEAKPGMSRRTVLKAMGVSAGAIGLTSARAGCAR